LALKVVGLKFLAISGSCGPHSSLNCYTALSCLTSKTIQGPVVKWSDNADYSGKTFLNIINKILYTRPEIH